MPRKAEATTAEADCMTLYFIGAMVITGGAVWLSRDCQNLSADCDASSAQHPRSVIRTRIDARTTHDEVLEPGFSAAGDHSNSPCQRFDHPGKRQRPNLGHPGSPEGRGERRICCLGLAAG